MLFFVVISAAITSPHTVISHQVLIFLILICKNVLDWHEKGAHGMITTCYCHISGGNIALLTSCTTFILTASAIIHIADLQANWQNRRGLSQSCPRKSLNIKLTHGVIATTLSYLSDNKHVWKRVAVRVVADIIVSSVYLYIYLMVFYGGGVIVYKTYILGGIIVLLTPQHVVNRLI